MRRSALSTCCALIVLALPATAAAQDSIGGLTFRDARPLSVPLSALGAPPTQARTTVCNTGTATARQLVFTRGGFGFRKGGRALRDGEVLAHTRLLRDRHPAHQLKPGQCATVALAPRPGAALDPGVYTGQLTITSVGGGIARRDLTIVGPPVPVPARSVADTVQIKVVHKSGPFHFLSANHGKQATVVLRAPPPGFALDIPDTCDGTATRPNPKTCPSLGAVAHNAQTGELMLAGGRPDPSGGVARLDVRVLGADDVGDYNGALDPSGQGDDEHAIKTTVSVTDAWWWALIALLLGSAMVILPQLWTRRLKPVDMLYDRADQIPFGYASGRVIFHGQGNPPRLPGIDPPEPGDIIVYVAAVRDAIGKYASSMVFIDNGTDAYKQIEASLDMAEDDIAFWCDPDGLVAALVALDVELDRLQDWLRDHQFAEQTPAICSRAAAVLAPRRLKIGEAKAVAADADGLVPLLRRWREHAEKVLLLQLWWRQIAAKMLDDGASPQRLAEHAQLGNDLAKYKRALREAKTNAALDALAARRPSSTELSDELCAAGTRCGVPAPQDEGGPVEMAPLWTRIGVTDCTQQLLRMTEVDLASAEELARGATAIARRPARPAQLDDSLRWLADAVCIAVAIAVALITAMAAIVNGKNFGSAGDYLTVIVIGTAAQAAVSGVIPSINNALGDRFGTLLRAPARPAGAKEA